MKKRVVAILLVGVFLLTACGSKNTVQENVKETESTASTSEKSENVANEDNSENNTDEKVEVVYDDSLIGETLSAEDTFKSQWDYEVNYKLHVPTILSEADGAKQLNETIQSQIGTIADSSLKQMKDELNMDIYSITYDTYWTDSLLSLVVRVLGDCEYEDYYVYNYDFQADRLLTNDEIFKIAGMKNDEYEKYACAAVGKRFDEGYEDFWNEEYMTIEESLDMYYQNVMGLRTRTFNHVSSDENIVYLDKGDLYLVATIETPAGGGLYNAICKVEKKDHTSGNADYGFVHVTFEDNRVTVAIDDTEDAHMFIPNLTKEMIDGVEVRGLHSYYKEIFIGNMGQDFGPVLFLISDNDTIEMVDVMDCAMSGYYCAFPVPGKYKPESFMETEVLEEDGFCGYQTVAATDYNGQEKDFSDCRYYKDFVMSSGYTYEGTWNASSYDFTNHDGTKEKRELALDLTRWEEEKGAFLIDFVIDDNKYVRYEGFMHCVGESDEGMVYLYSLHTEDYGEYLSGTLVFDFYNYESEGLDVKEVGEPNLFGNGGEWVTLLHAFG